MQIAFHIGANCTEEDRLLKSILKNADALLQQGIAVPGPGKYRKLLRETIQQLDGASPRPDTRDILIDAIVSDDRIRRIVLSNDNFIAIPRRIFDHAMFYPQIDSKVRTFQRVFREDELSFFLGIRNPASFLQDAARRTDMTSLSAFLGMTRLEDVSWADVVARIKRAAPQAQLFVWCHEDTPLIWEQLIRAQSGIAPETPIAGGYDLLAQVLTESGFAAAKAALDAKGLGIDARQDIIADALEAHLRPDMADVQIDLPGLDAATVDALTAAYEADVDRIATTEGVTFIEPLP